MAPITRPRVVAITISQYSRREFIKYTYQYLRRQSYLPSRWLIVDSSKSLGFQRLLNASIASTGPSIIPTGTFGDKSTQAEADLQEDEDDFGYEDEPNLFDDPKIDTLRDLIESFNQDKFTITYHESVHTKIGKMRDEAHTLVLEDEDIIVNFDDDDYYPRVRISASVAALTQGPSLLAGCCDPEMYDFQYKRLCKYINSDTDPKNEKPNYYACCGSFAYLTSFFRDKGPFGGKGKIVRFYDNNKNCDEERRFTNDFTEPIAFLESADAILISSHSQNTVSKKYTINKNEHVLAVGEKSSIELVGMTLKDVVYDPVRGYSGCDGESQDRQPTSSIGRNSHIPNDETNIQSNCSKDPNDANNLSGSEFCKSIIDFFDKNHHTIYISTQGQICNSLLKTNTDAIFYFGYLNNYDSPEFVENVKLIVSFLRNDIFRNVIVYDSPGKAEYFEKMAVVWRSHALDFIAAGTLTIRDCEAFDHWNYDMSHLGTINLQALEIRTFSRSKNNLIPYFFVVGANGFVTMYDLLKAGKIPANKIYLLLHENPNILEWEVLVGMYDSCLRDVVRVFKNKYHKMLFDSYLQDICKFAGACEGLESEPNPGLLGRYVYRPLLKAQYLYVPNGFDILKSGVQEQKQEQADVSDKSFRSFYFCDDTLFSLKRTLTILELLNSYTRQASSADKLYKLYIAQTLLDKIVDEQAKQALLQDLKRNQYVVIVDCSKKTVDNTEEQVAKELAEISKYCKIAISYFASINSVCKRPVLEAIAHDMIPIIPNVPVYKLIPGFLIKWFPDTVEFTEIIACDVFDFCERCNHLDSLGLLLRTFPTYSQQAMMAQAGILSWHDVCKMYL